MEGAQPQGLPANWPHEFLAVFTHPKIFNFASSYEQAQAQAQAQEQINAWIASIRALVLHSSCRHWRVLPEFTHKAKRQGGPFHDARTAAICIENSVSMLWGANWDFGRHKAVKTLNQPVWPCFFGGVGF